MPFKGSDICYGRSWHFMMANCVNMTACILVFQSLNSQPFHVFCPIVQFCFVSWVTAGLCHEHLFIFQSLLYLLWAVITKVILQISWLMLDKHFFHKGIVSGVTEWHDWSLHDQLSVLNNVQSKAITNYNITLLCGYLSCLYCEFSWQKWNAFL